MHVYRLLLWLLLPAAVLRLWWRGRREPRYRQQWAQRLGRFSGPVPDRLIWLHAVSLGETHASQPLVEALLSAFPGHAILLTHATPTGRAAGRKLFGDRVVQAWLPWDYPFAVRGFLRHFRPEIGILMETELWPVLLSACRQANIPVMLANGRLSARSAQRYRRFGSLVGGMLQGLCQLAAQSEADRERFLSLGARSVEVTGNLKFDVKPDASQLAMGREWRTRLAGRPVWLAASTREGEEALVLAAHRRLQCPGALLVLVPRHPQRFDEVAALVEQSGLRMVRRSSGDWPGPQCQVWLGDSMGELALWYALADVAVMGGSLLPHGGQNLIEPASVGCPVILGPHVWNFAAASQLAVQMDAAVTLNEPQALENVVSGLLSDAGRRQQMSAAGLAFSASQRGATERTISLVRQCLQRAPRGADPAEIPPASPATAASNTTHTV